MGLLKKKDKKTSSKMSARMAGGASGSQISSLRPRYVEDGLLSRRTASKATSSSAT